MLSNSYWSRAASRFKKAKIGNLGTSIELDADFSDLFSFCDMNMNLLKKHVKVACELAGFNTNTVDYINNLIFVEMNLFWERRKGKNF